MMHPKFRAAYKIVTRGLCPFCVALFALIAYDLVMPATRTDEVAVNGKTKHFRKGVATYHVQGHGRYRYNEAIRRSLYERVQHGDTLRVSLSRVLS
jgi:hypothetical protein